MNKFMKAMSYLCTALIASAATAFVLVLHMQGPLSAAGLSKLDQLGAIIDERFIGEADMTLMNDAAATAMVDSLGDRWSYYIPAADYQSFMEQMNNAYVGIGVTVAVTEDQSAVHVVNVTPGGPAEEAGLQAGDILMGTDGSRFETTDLNEIRSKIQGTPGTTVNMMIGRDGKTLQIEVERRQIQVTVASGEMITDKTGLIKITNFDERCFEETRAAIEQLLEQGADNLVFDVRFNPGGYKHELVKILDYLLEEGPLFRSMDYQGREEVDYCTDELHLDIPMAVLVNSESYSAAEFFAAALQEYDAAEIVGQQTFGKGYFQQTYQLIDGSAVGLSVGKYFTPQGVSLANVGITPDKVVDVDEETMAQIYMGALTPEEDPQIRAAVEILENGQQ